MNASGKIESEVVGETQIWKRKFLQVDILYNGYVCCIAPS